MKKPKDNINDFLDKIKSLSIKTGVKATDKCAHCGETLGEHHLIAVGGLIKAHLRAGDSQLNAGNEETAFAS